MGSVIASTLKYVSGTGNDRNLICIRLKHWSIARGPNCFVVIYQKNKYVFFLQEYEDEYNGRVEEDDIENKLALRQG